MPFKERQALIEKVQKLRHGRPLLCIFNFDRLSAPPLPGLTVQFGPDAKEVLYAVLKQTAAVGTGLDVCLYTRGGDVNSVWPMVSIIREWDADFEVLVPFRCHSAGTLLALGAKQICMNPLGELSPIDPSTGNQFNPLDPVEPKARMAISVEDVRAYREFVAAQYGYNDAEMGDRHAVLQPHFLKLTEQVHPLALGNVHRVHQQIKQLAEKLLDFHPLKDRKPQEVVEALTKKFYSHLHMISRDQAREILGDERVTFLNGEVEAALDELLRAYEDDFALRKMFLVRGHMGDNQRGEERFIGGAIESAKRGYLYETRVLLQQQSKLPPNVQVQLPPGQAIPLVPGLAREVSVDVTAQGWIRNKDPKGVTR